MSLRSETLQLGGPRRTGTSVGGGDVERRGAPRHEVRASLILEHGDAVGMCRVVDLSITGALFSTAGTSLPALEMWSQHEVSIVAYADPDLQVEVTGRIMRCVGDIYALDWSGDEQAKAAVAAFLEIIAQRGTADPRREDARPSPEPAPASSARVVATLLIEHGGRAEELVLIEVSSHGGLIASAGAALSKVRAGALLFLSLSRSDDPERKLDVAARVVSHEGHATRVDWSEEPGVSESVAALLGDLLPAS